MNVDPEEDDHLPKPSSPAGAGARRGRSLEGAPREVAGGLVKWGDRVLFAGAGLLLGFAAAYLYLERVPVPPQPPVSSTDPHAGVPGFNAGAVRDMPDGGGAAQAAKAQLLARVRELETAAAAAPENAELLVRLGNAAYDAEEWTQAISAYERSLKVKPGDPDVLTDLGIAYRNIQKFDRALELFSEALRVKPNHWQAIFNQIIVVGVDKGEAGKARELLAQFRKQFPGVVPEASLARIEKELSGKRG